MNITPTINIKGKLLDLSQPKVMGILNITPDSFSDGGQFTEPKNALKQAERMLNDGADIIDIGGMSSRPGAEIISADEELKRIMPVLMAVLKAFPNTVISIDTIYGKTATETINAGASIINDISAYSHDKAMLTAIAQLQCPYILMHMQGQPNTMQKQPSYNNAVRDIALFLKQKVDILTEHGVNDIIIDPGLGFGKTLEHNYQLLNSINYFKTLLNRPMLIGASRKSMLYKPLNIAANQADNASTVAHTLALLNGANILRTHNVKFAKECIKIVDLYTENNA